jgi:preprotein translocase subunit SecF
MEWIKPGSKYDFFGRRKTWFMISLVMMGVSLASLAVVGLNLGIDFAGGTKIIAAFKADAGVERTKIKETISALVEQKTKLTGTQIEVQDFDVGSDQAGTRRFVIYTEITSLIAADARAKLAGDLQGKLGEGVRVEAVTEGEDKFFITFGNKAAVPERTAAIQAAFQEQGYADLTIQSEEERLIELEYYKSINLAELESAKSADGAPSPFEKSRAEFEAEKAAKLASLQDDRFTVRIDELAGEARAALSAAFGDSFIEIESSTSVSASVGEDLLNDGLVAILYALIGILIYIGLRFDFRYSPGAVLALFHDTIITLGVFSLFQINFSQPIIAALLTIIGYSLNDTIVVYDRIREDVAKYKSKPLPDIINMSINETLSRTTLTAFTTLLVVIAIVLLGGGLIRDFALALLVGIVVGTYSSIFVASPLVVYLDDFFKRRAAANEKPVSPAAPATP